MSILIGTAGWSIPGTVAAAFPAVGSSLERYSARFRVAEINSSFHRAHRLSTWQRWHDSVPSHFRFSVKVPRQITHARKLVDCGVELGAFIEQAHTLREKLAILLVQLPPKSELDASVAASFFAQLRARTDAHIVCEPRHPSWFTDGADELLNRLRVARVAADPAICGRAASPGGWRGLSYWRLHGSPRIYRSSYADRIESYAAQLQADGPRATESWCIFDNTASGAGAGDALALSQLLRLHDG